MSIQRIVIASLAGFSLVSGAWAADAGKDLYTKTCGVCHAVGIAGAPKYGNAGDWQPRMAGGVAKLYASALKGTAKGMPPKGGNLDAPDADVRAAVDYMLAAVKTAPAVAKPASAAAKPATASVPAAPAATTAASAEPPAAQPARPVDVSSNTSGASAADINSFNRLLKPVGKRNPPPVEDGIHDPANDGTLALMAPLAAYGPLPKSLAGNRINWVKAIEEHKINPRWDRNDPNATPVVIDLNIVREVKGSMPDVVYPHKQHTEWLDCSNCHPGIFVPQKGANAISMAAILLGEKCGVCHGKVAFPVSECRLCHSKKKDVRPVQAATAAAK
ncbi:MAG: c-type cytochrome [Rhodocyclales bacterium]|nr:c-type cytochrome [Rhodocyclales bacterium]